MTIKHKAISPPASAMSRWQWSALALLKRSGDQQRWYVGNQRSRPSGTAPTSPDGAAFACTIDRRSGFEWNAWVLEAVVIFKSLPRWHDVLWWAVRNFPQTHIYVYSVYSTSHSLPLVLDRQSTSSDCALFFLNYNAIAFDLSRQVYPKGYHHLPIFCFKALDGSMAASFNSSSNASNGLEEGSVCHSALQMNFPAVSAAVAPQIKQTQTVWQHEM